MITSIFRIILILSIVQSVFIGCEKGRTYIKLADVDSLLVNDIPDSALKLLEQIPQEEISGKEEQAYYNLLMTQTCYRLYLPVTSDSMINISISYYKDKDIEKLARAYYYKGVTLHEIGRVREAVVNLKKAETLAPELNSNAFYNKLWESLDYVNKRAGEFSLALEYAKKNMDLSIRCKNNYWLAYAFNDMALCYEDLLEQDSAIHYINRCIPLLKDVPIKERVAILDNIGFLYLNVDTAKAFKYLKEAYKIEPSPSTLDNMACIYAERGDLKKADELWKEALKTADITSRINIMEAMMKYNKRYGFHENVSQIFTELKTVRDSLKMKQVNENVKDTQIEFDKKNEHRKKMATITYLAVALTVIMIIAAIITVYYIYKVRKMKKRNLAAHKKIQEGEQTIDILKNSAENDRKRIDDLNRMIDTLQDKKSESVNRGASLYIQIQEGGNIALWTRNDFVCVVDYYSTINAKFVCRIRNDYDNVSPKYQFFMILENEGKNDEDLQRIMCISDSSVRSIRSRIKSKLTEGKECL